MAGNKAAYNRRRRGLIKEIENAKDQTHAIAILRGANLRRDSLHKLYLKYGGTEEQLKKRPDWMIAASAVASIRRKAAEKKAKADEKKAKAAERKAKAAEKKNASSGKKLSKDLVNAVRAERERDTAVKVLQNAGITSKAQARALYIANGGKAERFDELTKGRSDWHGVKVLAAQIRKQGREASAAPKTTAAKTKTKTEKTKKKKTQPKQPEKKGFMARLLGK